MMLANRLVLAALVIVVHCEDLSTPVSPEQDIILSAINTTTATTTNDRHYGHEDFGDNRQGRMALHTEAPSSKAKREQALKNILTARRRQLLGSRASEMSKTLQASRASNNPRAVLSVSKENPVDMLEAEETRHGVYVTAPIGDEVSVIVSNDDVDVLELLNKENNTTSLEKVSKPANEVDESMRNALLIRINETNETVAKNSSQVSSAAVRSTKNPEHSDNRRKNTVAMPESLYNHFRPVESNIPVEDMTQFLYFGQKLLPDTQNTSTRYNNSLQDVTSTSSSTTANSRRRYANKRFSTTTLMPVPRLEDIVNEEMNIALERSTVERNKVPKTKNIFRSPGSGMYFRKTTSRPSDPTIATNVIPSRDVAPINSSVANNKRESVLLRNNKFIGDSSAHARRDQVLIVSDEGSNARVESLADTAHQVANDTNRNAATVLTQLQANPTRRDERRHQREENHGARLNDDKHANRTSHDKENEKNSEDSISIDRMDSSTIGTVSTSRNEPINRITTWQSVHSSRESTTMSTVIESETGTTVNTINDLTDASNKTSIIPTTPTRTATTTATLTHSSLRIVVTEPMGYDATDTPRPSNRSPEDEKPAREDSGYPVKEVPSDIYPSDARDTVKEPENLTTDRTVKDFVRLQEHSKISILNYSSSVSPSTNEYQTNLSLPIPRTPEDSEESNDSPNILPFINSETINEKPQLRQEQQQRHAYAYEITNVTRLLRNYTGLKIELEGRIREQGKENRKESESEEEEIEEERSDEKNEKNFVNKRAKGKEEKEELRRDGRLEERGKEVEKGPAALTRSKAGSSGQEIRNGGGSVQPRLPLLLLLLPTPHTNPSSSGSSSSSTSSITSGNTTNVGGSSSGGIVEPARMPGRLSAGTDVGEVTAGTGASVVDRSGGSSSGGAAAAAGGSGGGNVIGTRNTLPPAFPTLATSEVSRASTVAPDDDSSANSLPKIARKEHLATVTQSTLLTSTLRWNHTGNSRHGSGSDRGTYSNDRRSNSRKSTGANEKSLEDSVTKEIKRRRGSATFFSSSLNSRNNKGWRNSAGEDLSPALRSSSHENRTGILSERSHHVSKINQTLIEEDAIGGNWNKFNRGSDTIGDIEMGVVTVKPQNRTLESMEMDVTTVLPPSTLDSPVYKQMNHDQSGNSEITLGQTSKSGEKLNFDENTSDSSPSVPITTERTNDETMSTLASTENPKFGETTIPPPVFPVTPRMLVDSSAEVGKPADEASETVRPTVETRIEDRPFGLAKDLDPSEIQKMYRAKTTTLRSLDETYTTIIPDTESATNLDVNPGETHPSEEPARTSSPMNSSITRRPLGGDRSPEVRGRNLSDKSKDKDDILPIMQLYNNSDIFNATDNNSQVFGLTTTQITPGVTNETGRIADPDLGPKEIAETPADRTESPDASRNSSRYPGSNLPSGNTRKSSSNNGHDTSDEDTNSIPTRSNSTYSGNNHFNSSQSNRTRHRPTYHQTMAPEHVGYRPELNSSFFQPGVISVSPRESINISDVISKRHDGDTIATQETVAVVSYILATLVVFPIAVGVALILRRLIIRNRKVLEESDTSSEISCRKDALNLENGDFKTSIEKAITKLPRIQHLCHEAEKPPPPTSQESRWEFPRDKLRLQTVLGQGNFGQVWKAEADNLTGHQGTTRLVAVKTVKEGASAREKEDLVRELEIMQQLGSHPNVVTLLGCCTEEEPHYLILEYVMYGKLLAYLRDHRTRQDFYNFSEDSAALTSRDLTVFGYCVARGMEYLASKKIIHRDLAARNVLVDHNKLCKIADFGMSRFANDEGEVIEARHGRNALPIRWMAPESLIYSLFTTKTDVWSFGILMWEIVTLGSTPYPDMAAREVMRNVQNGYRLERPSHCRSELFRVISRCWHADPDRRPEFQILRRDMAQLLEDSMNGHYVDLESFASECTD